LRLLISSNICNSERETRRSKGGRGREENRSGTERGERKRGRESLKQDDGGSRKTTQASTQTLETTQVRERETLGIKPRDWRGTKIEKDNQKRQKTLNINKKERKRARERQNCGLSWDETRVPLFSFFNTSKALR
jgi:hypothetical protein